MKRRTFLTAAGTVGIIGAASSATIVSSVYTSMNTSVLLEEFNVPTKNALDNFIAEIKLNSQALGFDEKIVSSIAMPTLIISNDSSDGNHHIIYKNKAGRYISLSVTKGVEKIKILETL